ncbi:hypothetical protein RRG08_019648 [Elysia crispata]|uniref:Uncharacterized protein n=1 Tax=Elysia crispata TaxID=231223 RepID=A0AAE1B1Q8_9GAST|nr:hypothetical protein RRG08_019648 [Elysia crispata]
MNEVIGANVSSMRSPRSLAECHPGPHSADLKSILSVLINGPAKQGSAGYESDGSSRRPGSSVASPALRAEAATFSACFTLQGRYSERKWDRLLKDGMTFPRKSLF